MAKKPKPKSIPLTGPFDAAATAKRNASKRKEAESRKGEATPFGSPRPTNTYEPPLVANRPVTKVDARGRVLSPVLPNAFTSRPPSNPAKKAPTVVAKPVPKPTATVQRGSVGARVETAPPPVAIPKSTARLAPAKKRPAKKSVALAVRAPAGTTRTAATPTPDYLAEARAMIQASLKPYDAAVAQQVQATEADTMRQGAAIQNAYQALADYQKPEAAQTQGIYNGAAQQTAAFGKGFSDTFQKLTGQSADAANALLAENGSPQQVQPGTGQADVLYGLGGAMPANELAQQGAAFASSAALRPGNTKALGTQNFVSNVFQGKDAVQKIRSDAQLERAKALGQIPELVTKLQNAASQAEALAIQNDIKNAYLELAGVKEQRATAVAKDNSAQAWARLDIQSKKLLSDLYGVDENGNPTLAGKRAAATVKKNRAQKVTASKYATLKQNATKAAYTLYWGDEDKDIAGVDYQTALSQIMNGYSVRLADAQKILDTYYKPGEDGRPFLTFQQRQALKRKGVSDKSISAAMWDGGQAQALLGRL